MIQYIDNHVTGMISSRNSIHRSFGKDLTGKIEYRFNQQGFRGRDFDFVPAHAFFGCSMVFGVGVPEEQTFPYLFSASHNYGLAGKYDNHDVMIVLEKFVHSDLYKKTTKIAVIWHERDTESLEKFYHVLKEYDNIIHFYCGSRLTYPRCYQVPKNIDMDVSSTHMGPKSHYFFYKALTSIFQKS